MAAGRQSALVHLGQIRHSFEREKTDADGREQAERAHAFGYIRAQQRIEIFEEQQRRQRRHRGQRQRGPAAPPPLQPQAAQIRDGDAQRQHGKHGRAQQRVKTGRRGQANGPARFLRHGPVYGEHGGEKAEIGKGCELHRARPPLQQK